VAWWERWGLAWCGMSDAAQCSGRSSHARPARGSSLLLRSKHCDGNSYNAATAATAAAQGAPSFSAGNGSAGSCTATSVY
jgi:hypothetical protein